MIMSPAMRKKRGQAMGGRGAGGGEETEVFQASRDTDVFPDLPTRNYGITENLLNNSGKKSLLFFDLASISDAKACHSAKLRLVHTATQGGSVPFTLTVYAVAIGNAGWLEGTKNNATAGAGEPCWNAKAANGAGGVTTAWAGSAGLETSGADFEAVALGTASGDRSNPVGTIYEIALTAARITEMFGVVNENYGLLVTISTNTLGVGSRNNATAAYRPTLEVTYGNP